MTKTANILFSTSSLQALLRRSSVTIRFAHNAHCPLALPGVVSTSSFFSTPSIRPGASIRRGAISCWLPSHYRIMKMICILAPQKLSGIINLHDNYIVDKSNRKSLLRACRCCVFVAVYLRTPIAIIFKYNACTIFVCIK